MPVPLQRRCTAANQTRRTTRPRDQVEHETIAVIAVCRADGGRSARVIHGLRQVGTRSWSSAAGQVNTQSPVPQADRDRRRDPDARKAFTGEPRRTSGCPCPVGGRSKSGRAVRGTCSRTTPRSRADGQGNSRPGRPRHRPARAPDMLLRRRGATAIATRQCATNAVVRKRQCTTNAVVGKTMHYQCCSRKSRLVRPWTSGLDAPKPKCHWGKGSAHGLGEIRK
jgi:hypothetical protein